jgi:hypothetical protein
MPAFLEDKLKREYGSDSATPYKIMNKLGALRGNKETAKGRAMQAKHDADAKERDAAHGRNTRRGFALPGIKKITLAMLKGSPAK